MSKGIPPSGLRIILNDSLIGNRLKSIPKRNWRSRVVTITLSSYKANFCPKEITFNSMSIYIESMNLYVPMQFLGPALNGM